ncbi:LruC domain-containing protein [Flavobacterium sp. RSSB_23]|uniref:LruC domain-containing protein n=1 Tax=Flavobacterium sp. RSSB_23 TaxID=3447668 RepID=UPI003F35527F
MKKISPKTSLVLVATLLILLYSCAHDTTNDNTPIPNSSTFDFKTTKQVKVSLSVLNSENKPIGGVFVQIYTQNPLTTEGLLKANSSDFLAFKGISSTAGIVDFEIAPQTFVDSISVLVDHVGFPSLKQIKIDSNTISAVIGGSNPKTNKSATNLKTNATVVLPEPTKKNGYYALGSWDNLGKPNYLWNTDDKIANDFLADVNASLPERKKLTDSHPEYFATTDNGNIELIADAEVWITFVHEGTGYKNTLGYYTHKNDNPPNSKTEIKDATILFPNSSYTGSGGSLRSGNKVQLLYLDPVTNKYTTVFPKGTTIAWFLITAGFSTTNGAIGTGINTYYSDTRFNPEKSESKKKHNVVLKDVKRQLFLVGFEDLQREGNTDDDFNDVVFYSTVSPYTAAKTDNIRAIDTPTDSDGDGVGDTLDEFPTEPTKAFNNYYPSKNNVGTLAFEDLWPYKGDYDFNDLVLDYNFNQVTNAENKVVEVNAAITVRAIGASLKNGFSLQFNTIPTNVKSVTGQSLNNGVFVLNSNGTEQKQSKAVIPIFDDPFKVLNYNGSIVNTYVGGAYAAPKTINTKIEFITAIPFSNFGTPPYNPFIVINAIRGKEIHLPASAPTDLADKSLFGTGDDNTNLSIQKYYMSDTNLPWAINIPMQFAYPAEKQDITKAFLVFNQWTKSQGFNYMDWYMDKNGYRDTSKLFKK